MANGLTLKRQRFVEAYLGEAAGNATEAARIAGYKNPNQQACVILAKRSVQEAIEKAKKAAPKKLTPEKRFEILDEIATDGDKNSDRLGAIKLDSQLDGSLVHKHGVQVDAEVRAVVEQTPDEAVESVIKVFKADEELWELVKGRVEG